MLREQIISEWNGLKTKLAQLKAKSIDNYPRLKKITLLNLESYFLQTNDNQAAAGVLCNLFIKNGSVTKTSAKIGSQTGVELMVEVLEVAILKDLSTEDNHLLTNYVQSELALSSRPPIQLID